MIQSPLGTATRRRTTCQTGCSGHTYVVKLSISMRSTLGYQKFNFPSSHMRRLFRCTLLGVSSFNHAIEGNGFHLIATRTLRYACSKKATTLKDLPLFIIPLFLALKVVCMEGGISSTTTSVLLHLDDATASILCQNAHHTPAYW
ncbi:hypothetical protein F2P79_022426 [Pimephales promelas]|nr:hypothetical protein F2P79_022426 [Pimephales promelas]